MLSEELRYIDHTINDDTIIFYVESKIKSPVCPYCGEASNRKHSYYNKSFMDIPLNNKKVEITIKNRKMFCDNKNCTHKTFAETYDFVERKSRKTKRLTEYVINTSVNMSSISAQHLLRKNGVKISKSTICTLLKKR
jgi:transposase